MLEVRLPFPPRRASINHLYRVGEHGKLYKSREAKRWQAEAARIVRLAAEKQGWQDEGFYVDVVVTFYTPDRRKRDMHNYLKIIADAVAEGLGMDDERILFIMQPPQLDRADPRVELMIEHTHLRDEVTYKRSITSSWGLLTDRSLSFLRLSDGLKGVETGKHTSPPPERPSTGPRDPKSGRL